MDIAHSYVQIDLDAVQANFRAIREKAGVPVMAVIKADAYGHGAVVLAKLLESDAGFFGVASVAEALELRHAGITRPILVLGGTPDTAIPEAVRHEIRLPIFRYTDAETLSREAVRQKKTAYVHLAVDTGMSRIGMQATEESADKCARIARLPGLCVEGLFSHFAAADCADLASARQQEALFDAFDAMLRSRGVQVSLRHLNNSAGIMNFSRHYEMVRAGIVLYGLYPSDEVDKTRLPLRPVLSWHSRVAYVKTLEPGRRIGYGGTFTVQRQTVVATVPVGYADGYCRSLSNCFYVLIRGQRAPILGRVCMDQLMVDVTDIPGAACSDPVTLVGRDGDECITVEAIAEAAGSFHYEFVCGIGRRVPRVYVRGGNCVQTVNYLLSEQKEG